MFLEEIGPFLPFITLIAFIITIVLIFYRLGRWTEHLDTNLKNISDKMDKMSEKIDKMPENFWAKFIDAYKLLTTLKTNPRTTRKEELLEKAKNYTRTLEESLELRDIMEKEAKAAQAVGDFLKLMIILGILIFLGILIAELFGEG